MSVVRVNREPIICVTYSLFYLQRPHPVSLSSCRVGSILKFGLLQTGVGRCFDDVLPTNTYRSAGWTRSNARYTGIIPGMMRISRRGRGLRCHPSFARMRRRDVTCLLRTRIRHRLLCMLPCSSIGIGPPETAPKPAPSRTPRTRISFISSAPCRTSLLVPISSLA